MYYLPFILPVTHEDLSTPDRKMAAGGKVEMWRSLSRKNRKLRGITQSRGGTTGHSY